MVNVLLLIFSIFIYSYFSKYNLIYIFISILTTYYASHKIENKKNKFILIFTIILNSSILIFFKIYLYDNFFGLFPNKSILVPLGISYYTFQNISYLVDVYKGKIKSEKKFLNYCLYILYFPYLFIGPINRYEEIKQFLNNKRKITKENLINGIIRILWGLFKKLIIAERLFIIVNTIASNYEYSGAYTLFACLIYSILLYSDFSGGIDIVLGISKIFGIKLVENFDVPFLSQNLKEFWRRWHISLSNWLKDYIYIPLGGNKKGPIRNKINIIITFTISGLWHGVNYILWGFFHGLLLVFQGNKKTKFKLLNITLNYIIVSLLWIFFIYPKVNDSVQMFISIFTNNNYIEMLSNIRNFGLNLVNYIILLTSIIILFIFEINKNNIIDKIVNYSFNKKLILIFTLIIILLIFGIYGIGFNIDNFIYSNF